MNRFDLDWLSQWSGLADGRLAPLLAPWSRCWR